MEHVALTRAAGPAKGRRPATRKKAAVLSQPEGGWVEGAVLAAAQLVSPASWGLTLPAPGRAAHSGRANKLLRAQRGRPQCRREARPKSLGPKAPILRR